MTISTNNGAGNDNVFAGTLWDDDAGDTNAPGPVTDNAYVNLVAETPLVPEEAMGAFVGEDPSGQWTLDILDAVPQFDDGILNSWALHITRATCAAAVGGVTSFPIGDSGSSSGLIAAWAGGATGALVILAVGGWYIRRRFMVQREPAQTGEGYLLDYA